MQYRSLPSHSIPYHPLDFSPSFPVLFFPEEPWGGPNPCPESLHFHNCMEIGHCLSGNGYLCFGSERRFPFQKGEFFLNLPQTSHTVISGSFDTRLEYLYIEPGLLRHQNESCGQLWDILCLPQKIPHIINRSHASLSCYLSRIFKEMSKKEPLFQKAVHGLLLSLASELNRYSQTAVWEDIDGSSEYHSHVSAALTYIYSHYNQPLPVSLLARECGISASHLRRLFCAATGTGPLEFIQRYRIQQACHLIRSGQLPFKQIAHQLGYVNLSSFNRQFRQYMNQSPSEWKKTAPKL